MGFAADKVAPATKRLLSCDKQHHINPLTSSPPTPSPLPPRFSSLIFRQAEYALRVHHNSLDAAMDFLLGQADDWQPPPEDQALEDDGAGRDHRDGDGDAQEDDGAARDHHDGDGDADVPGDSGGDGHSSARDYMAA